MMQLINFEGLIGDGLSTLPVMYDLATIHGGLEVKSHPEIAWMYDLIPEKYDIKVIEEIDYGKPYLELNIGDAFRFSMENGTYMNQSWHHQVGLPTPDDVIPELNVPDIDVPVYDYVFAPFSRSTPEDQKWDRESWFELGKLLNQQGYSVCALGNSKHDDKLYFQGGIYGSPQKPLPYIQFDRPMVEVINILKKARKGCISINTGISHLCYVVGCKNYLLNNQGKGWAVQPNAISIETYIPRITVEELLEFIKNN